MHVASPTPVSAINAMVEESRRITNAGDRVKGLQHAHAALLLAEQSGDAGCIANALDCLTRAYHISRQSDLALQASYRALDHWTRTDDSVGAAQGLMLHATLLHSQGMTAEAVDAGHLALRKAEAAGDAPTEIWSACVLAGLYGDWHQFDHGEPMFIRALDAARALGDFKLLALCISNFGAYCATHGNALRISSAKLARRRFEQALALHRESLELWRTLDYPLQVEATLANICWTSIQVGDYDGAEAANAEHMLHLTADGVREASCLMNTGELLLARGQFAAAQPVLQRALLAHQRGGDCKMSMQCELRLSEACERMDDPVGALEHHRCYHALYAQVASETEQRRVRAAAVRYETQRARAAAETERLRAENLERSNEALSSKARHLSRDALNDALTGIANRRHLEIMLGERWARNDGAFSIALLDVDHFKRINDTLSHAVGDEVLRQLGSVLAQCCRNDDFVARYGGEEFAMVLHDANPQAVHTACERLRVAVQQHAWNLIDIRLAVTVSVGVASRTEASALEAMVHLADQRLYKAKAAGRNQVIGR